MIIFSNWQSMFFLLNDLVMVPPPPKNVDQETSPLRQLCSWRLNGYGPNELLERSRLRFRLTAVAVSNAKLEHNINRSWVASLSTATSTEDTMERSQHCKWANAAQYHAVKCCNHHATEDVELQKRWNFCANSKHWSPKLLQRQGKSAHQENAIFTKQSQQFLTQNHLDISVKNLFLSYGLLFLGSHKSAAYPQEPLLRVIRSPDFAGPATFVALEATFKPERVGGIPYRIGDLMWLVYGFHFVSRSLADISWFRLLEARKPLGVIKVGDSQATQNVVVAICEEQRSQSTEALRSGNSPQRLTEWSSNWLTNVNQSSFSSILLLLLLFF